MLRPNLLAGLRDLNSWRPLALDVGQDRPNLSIVELIPETQHVALISPTDYSSRAQLGDLEQQLISVVPGVAAGVVRRGWKETVVITSAPIGLPFKIGAVAGGAMLLVKDFPLCDQLRIGSFRPLHGAIRLELPALQSVSASLPLPALRSPTPDRRLHC